ncbi:MAG: PAS domain-containing protein, partial [Hoeflea sp.]|nr:PAS domain-containing protein [Hoeflea sp.]
MKNPDTTIFDLAPVAMWIEDFSGVKEQFDRWRAEGVSDLRAYLAEDLTRVAACASRIKVLQVNKKTLDLFEADSFEHLVENLAIIFNDEMLENHANELAELWNGKTEFCSNAV